MKQLTATRLVLLLGVTAATICISGFREKDGHHHKSFRTHHSRDTTTPGKHSRNPDIELNKGMQHLDIELQKLDDQIKKLDFSKMQKVIDESISKIDFEKIDKQIEASLAKIDQNNIDGDIKEAMDKVKRIDLSKGQEEIKKVHNDLEKHRKEINVNSEKIKKDVSEAIEKAKVSIENAKVEIKQMKEFIDALEADKLIDKNKAYKIEVKEGELYIDDKKQPQEITDKFHKYFKKDNYIINNGGKKRVSI